MTHPRRALALACLGAFWFTMARAAPCFELLDWMQWPPANARLTNTVPIRAETLEADWKSVRLFWGAESNTLYQVQFGADLRGPWFAYADVVLTNYSATVLCDFPVFCGQTRFLRVRR